jgi:GDP-L-fucose synthase
MKKESKIYVAGNTGLVGSAIVRKLQSQGYNNIVSSPRSHFDLRKQFDVEKFFNNNQPEYVFLAAARCGGIFDNLNYPVDYLLDNLNIQSNIISMAHKYGVKKLMFFASSCIYPKNVEMPIKEDDLLRGELEPTNEAYSIAKIAGIKLCEAYRKQHKVDFISVNPCNLYGPGDKVHPLKGHVMSCLIYKFWKAKRENLPMVECFGDGSPKREFLYVDDLADASLYLMNKDTSETDTLINIGAGTEISIKEIAELISDVVEYDGEIHWDTSKPNGALRRILDVSKVNALGWEAKTSLIEGIKKVICDLDERYG